MKNRLRELAPTARGTQEAGSRNLVFTFQPSTVFTFRKIAVSAFQPEPLEVLDQLVVVVGQGVVEEGVHRRVLLGQVLHEPVQAPHEVAREEVVAGPL